MPNRCQHPFVMVEIQHGWSWTQYTNGKPFRSGEDHRDNPRIFVCCGGCDLIWRITENALPRCPKWMREHVQPALDEWWGRAPSAPAEDEESLARIWFRAKGGG